VITQPGGTPAPICGAPAPGVDTPQGHHHPGRRWWKPLCVLLALLAIVVLILRSRRDTDHDN
jgi:hypothetical protein